jgi:hypothetical protein
MKIRFYFDEDAMDWDLVQALRTRGVDVTTANLENMIHRTDPEHLEYATTQGRVLYSFNVQDYMKIHTQYLMEERQHTGIILSLQQQYSIGEQMRRLLKIMSAKTAADLQNTVEFLSRWNA